MGFTTLGAFQMWKSPLPSRYKQLKQDGAQSHVNYRITQAPQRVRLLGTTMLSTEEEKAWGEAGLSKEMSGKVARRREASE